MILSSDRKFVERYWLYVKCWVRDLDSYGTDQINVALCFTEEDIKYGRNYFRRWQKDDTKEGHLSVWSAARKFTEARLEEIKRVNEELQFLEISLTGVKQGAWDDGYIAVVERIIAREEDTLAELKRGMR